MNFERVPNEGEEGEEAHRVIHRTLFSRLAHFPLKKSMTFNKHSSDFHFSVSYGDLTFLTPQQVAHVDKVTLVNVTLSGVKEAFAKNNDSLSRGVKAHFKMDENCILHLEAVEASFEKTSLQVQEEQQQESTFSRIGKSFSNFFGGSSDSQGDKVCTLTYFTNFARFFTFVFLLLFKFSFFQLLIFLFFYYLNFFIFQ